MRIRYNLLQQNWENYKSPKSNKMLQVDIFKECCKRFRKGGWYFCNC